MLDTHSPLEVSPDVLSERDARLFSFLELAVFFDLTKSEGFQSLESFFLGYDGVTYLFSFDFRFVG